MDKTAIGTERLYSEYDRIYNKIYELYYDSKLSISEIKDLVGYKSSTGSFANFLSKFIKFRSFSQATNNAIKLNKLKPKIHKSKFKIGYHITWNNKCYFYRSSYEEAFCKELDLQQIDYEVESLRIEYFDSVKRKVRIAIPDFYIPSSNTIIEVKSKYTLDIQNMYDRFTEYKKLGYKVDLLLDYIHYYDMTYFL